MPSLDTSRASWRKSSRSNGNGGSDCVEVACIHDAPWRKSRRSQNNANCVEVACLHDAPWRKSGRSSNNANCVEVAPWRAVIALRDSKLPTEGDFPVLAIPAEEWSGLVDTIRTGRLDG